MAAREKEADPATQLAQLASVLERSPLPRVIVVRGDERWFRDQALARSVAAAQRAGLDVARYDAQDPDFQLRNLCDDLCAPPMFAAARCVLVRSATALLRKEAGDESPLLRAVLAFVNGRTPEGLLVVEAEGLRADHALAKACNARGGVLLSLRKLYDQPGPWERNADPRNTELVRWLAQHAREKGLKLSSDEALYVATATGNDLSALASAVERLRARGTQSVRDMIGFTASSAPWKIAEDFARGDAARALKGLEALFRHGLRDDGGGAREVDPKALQAMFLGSLRGKVRASLALALAVERGLDREQAGRAAGAKTEWALKELEARAPGVDAAQWEARLRDLASLERRARSSVDVDLNDLALMASRWRRVVTR